MLESKDWEIESFLFLLLPPECSQLYIFFPFTFTFTLFHQRPIQSNSGNKLNLPLKLDIEI